MRHIRWVVPKESVGLNNPVVTFGFSGWNDAGRAATTSLASLIASSDARLVAEVDPEIFTDFASIRPEVRLDADGNRTIDWPTVRLYAATMPGTDALIVVGPEPALRWRRFSEELIEVFELVGAELVVALGALVADVPHTRPTPVYGLSNDDATIERHDLHRSEYEGPTGIVGVIVTLARAVGLPTASLWAAVPSYVAQIVSPAAVAALTNRACDLIGTPVPTLDLDEEMQVFNNHLTTLFAEDEDLERYVTRLEVMIDEEGGDDDQSDASPQLSLGEIDSASIAAEIEQFLRDQDDD